MDTEKYKKKLEEEKEEIKKQLEKTKSSSVDFGSDIDGGDEESDETEEISAKFSLEQTLKDSLLNIEYALSKFTDGSYGKCEKCAKEIEENILEVNPESKFCKVCKAGM